MRGTILKVKGTVTNQSSNDRREVIGASFAANAIKRFGQLIVLLNECTTSFAASCIVPDEKTDALRDALSQLVIGLHPLDCPKAILLVDLAPGLVSLMNTSALQNLGVSIAVGRVKKRQQKSCC